MIEIYISVCPLVVMLSYQDKNSVKQRMVFSVQIEGLLSLKNTWLIPVFISTRFQQRSLRWNFLLFLQELHTEICKILLSTHEG